MAPPPAILLYDRDCRFCVWGVVALARRSRPGTLVLAPLQGRLGDRHLGHLSVAARGASWHLWDGERLRSEADVLDGLAPRLRTTGLRVLVAIGRSLPRPLVAAGYRRVAARRAVLSRIVPGAWKRRAAGALRHDADVAPASVD